MDNQGTQQSRSALKAITLFVVFVLLAGGTLEIAARAMAAAGVMGFTTEAGAIIPDAAVGWKLSPAFSGSMGGVQMRSSAQGDRIADEGQSPQEKKAPLSVWLLGDSFVFGWGLDWSDTVGAQLQALLPEGSRVYNLGVPGYGFAQSLIRLRSAAEELPAPDAVFVLGNPLDFLDDLQPGTLIFERPSFQCASDEPLSCVVEVPGAVHWFLWRSSTAYRNLRFFLEQKRTPPQFSSEDRERFSDVVRGFRKAVASKGATLFPVLHKPEKWAEGSTGSDPLATAGWVDISRSLKLMIGDGVGVQRDGIHWTALASQNVARILRGMLGRKLEALSPPVGCGDKREASEIWECVKSDRGWLRSRSVGAAGEKVNIAQVYVPPGAGFMGPTEEDLKSATASIKSVYGPQATREYFLNETPAQVVYLDGFWIDATEVTHAAFSLSHPPGTQTLAERRGYTVAYRGQGKFKQLDGSSWRKPGWLDTRVEDMSVLPVTGVTWLEARQHCASLGLALPTEAQWERAARGPDGRRYPWGQEKPSCTRANAGYFPKSLFCAKRPLPVGERPAGQSVYGLHDVAGNVFEWVGDCRTDGYYWMPEGEAWMGFPVNPTPPPAAYADDCKSRMMRGGSWAFGYDAYLRGGARAVEEAATMAEWSLGFRCGSDL